MIVRVCAWCDKTLSAHTAKERVEAEEAKQISHGMCKKCEAKVRKDAMYTSIKIRTEDKERLRLLKNELVGRKLLDRDSYTCLIAWLLGVGEKEVSDGRSGTDDRGHGELAGGGRVAGLLEWRADTPSGGEDAGGGEGEGAERVD
jgi:hypothetical protein